MYNRRAQHAAVAPRRTTFRLVIGFAVLMATLASIVIGAPGREAPTEVAVPAPLAPAVAPEAAPAVEAAPADAAPAADEAQASPWVWVAPTTTPPAEVLAVNALPAPVAQIALLPDDAAAAQPIAVSTPVEPEPLPADDPDPVGIQPDNDVVEIEVAAATVADPPVRGDSLTTEVIVVPVEPEPEPEPVYDPWLPVRMCESTNNYSINTGNGFYGAYQFTISTWNWVAGIIGRTDLSGVRPDLASPADQDRMANALAFEVAGGGLGHWPVCGRLYGT